MRTSNHYHFIHQLLQDFSASFGIKKKQTKQTMKQTKLNDIKFLVHLPLMTHTTETKQQKLYPIYFNILFATAIVVLVLPRHRCLLFLLSTVITR